MKHVFFGFVRLSVILEQFVDQATAAKMNVCVSRDIVFNINDKNTIETNRPLKEIRLIPFYLGPVIPSWWELFLTIYSHADHRHSLRYLTLASVYSIPSNMFTINRYKLSFSFNVSYKNQCTYHRRLKWVVVFATKYLSLSSNLHECTRWIRFHIKFSAVGQWYSHIMWYYTSTLGRLAEFVSIFFIICHLICI